MGGRSFKGIHGFRRWNRRTLLALLVAGIVAALWWGVLRLAEPPSWPPAPTAVTADGALQATADFVSRDDVTVSDLGTQFAWSTAASVEPWPEGRRFFPRMLDDIRAAREDERPVGHILFTAARLEGAANPASISLLAPLAVVPADQGRGVGGRLIEQGLQLLSESGVDLVFVLGHPQYSPRHGFEPAGRLGLAAPFPIPEEDADAWMVQALRAGVIGSVRGTLVCADSLNCPEHWRE